MSNVKDARCAVWYWHYHSLRVSLSNSEVDAAQDAVEIEEEGYGAVDGVQFSDGRVFKANEWTMYNELKAERSKEITAQVMAEIAAEAKNPPPAPKTVKSPFDNSVATLHGDYPEWVGK